MATGRQLGCSMLGTMRTMRARDTTIGSRDFDEVCWGPGVIWPNPAAIQKNIVPPQGGRSIIYPQTTETTSIGSVATFRNLIVRQICVFSNIRGYFAHFNRQVVVQVDSFRVSHGPAAHPIAGENSASDKEPATRSRNASAGKTAERA